MFCSRSLFKLSVLFLLAALLSACSQNNNDSRAVHYETNEEMREALATWQVECSGADCNPSVGQLVTVTGAKSVELCTGFLAEDANTFVTNDHCLEMYRSGEVCTGRSYIYFRQNGQTLRVNCLNIAMRTHKATNEKNLTNGFENYPDIGVLKIDGASLQRPASLHQKVTDQELGLSVDQVHPAASQLYGYVVDPSESGEAVGYMRRVACEVTPNTTPLGLEVKTKAAVLLQNCYLKKGNSGSPLFNESGRVAAVVFGMNNYKSLLATNLSCLKNIRSNPEASICMQ
ncbi:MAG: hypothetical protein COT74_14295 [Bdellovibrionales bacterium CG10_big_fil_rev_8_21_14_0_10_45_34]|nr:MAG: hypothetical protein COT74_14295 [Bdellovibrionales bacterium CG10_big_fil_rev_8_21_14_0_10_45_34]